jgi:hypothetical protein
MKREVKMTNQKNPSSTTHPTRPAQTEETALTIYFPMPTTLTLIYCATLTVYNIRLGLMKLNRSSYFSNKKKSASFARKWEIRQIFIVIQLVREFNRNVEDPQSSIFLVHCQQQWSTYSLSMLLPIFSLFIF